VIGPERRKFSVDRSRSSVDSARTHKCKQFDTPAMRAVHGHRAPPEKPRRRHPLDVGREDAAGSMENRLGWLVPTCCHVRGSRDDVDVATRGQYPTGARGRRRSHRIAWNDFSYGEETGNRMEYSCYRPLSLNRRVFAQPRPKAVAHNSVRYFCSCDRMGTEFIAAR
jgi:hypothetical protein